MSGPLVVGLGKRGGIVGNIDFEIHPAWVWILALVTFSLCSISELNLPHL